MCHSLLPLACVLRVLQPVKVIFSLGTLALSGPLALESSADRIRACPTAYHLSCMAQILY